MKKVVFFATAIIVLATFNLSIYAKERIIAAGETVLLELAPVDPRSLIQGDYMQLRYAIEREAGWREDGTRGYLVISKGANQVAQFERFYGGEALSPSEKLVRFHGRPYNTVRIVPDSFMFQEGQADRFRAARYGVFKFDAAGGQVLVGLADAERQLIRLE